MLKIAFAGVGHWHAAMHAQAAVAAGASIVASWDPAPSRVAAFASQHGGCQSASLEDLFRQGPDLVVIMGKPAEIATRGLVAIESGIPVLIEKPIGISAAAADPLIEAASRRKAFVAVALPHGIGMLKAVAELADKGRLGLLSHTYFRLINGPPQRYVDDDVAWVLERETSGGGALRNLGIHGIAAFLALAGDQRIEIVSASIGRPLHGTSVEDYAAVVLRADNGMLGLIEAGYTFASMTRGLFEWRISAKNATLTDLGTGIEVATLDDRQQRQLPATPPARRYDDVMRETLNRLVAGAPPSVSLFDCRRAMDIIDRCYAMQGT